MSYRYITNPDQALGGVLADLSRRVAIIEQRIRWPGATQFAENLVGVSPLVAGWNNICEIELTAGRWMLYGSAELEGPSTSIQELRFRDSGVAVGSQTSFYGSIAAISVIGSVLLPLGGFAVLEAQSDSPASSQSNVAFIIAVPT